MHSAYYRIGIAVTAIILLFGGATDIRAENPSVSRPQHLCLSGGIKKTIVFLGVIQPANPSNPQGPGTPFPIATGVVVNQDSISYLVTAKHVLGDLERLAVPPLEGVVFLNKTSGGGTFLLLTDVKKMFATDWIASSNADLAVIRLPAVLDGDVRAIPDNLFLASDSLAELQEVFFFSYQPNTSQAIRVNPIARGGMVSLFNDDSTFLIDATAYPGNSGSPVFVKPTYKRGPQGEFVQEAGACSFVGIVGEYVPYQEWARSEQTGRRRVMFEENTGLTRVWPVQAIHELFNSPMFKLQHERFKKQVETK